MIISIEIGGQTIKIDDSKPLNLAIPLKFNGTQPNAYDVERASSKPCEAGELVGDTRRGGSCNFEQITLIPHCNGTHTECVGHITHERIFVNDCLKDVFVFAELISVSPEKAGETTDTYAIKLDETDLLITKSAIETALQSPKTKNQRPKSLIVRTLPNDSSKLSKTYLDEIPPFFSTEAMEFLNELGIEHLLVDLPSIDRIFDEGKLNNHRIFWNVEAGKFELNAKSFSHKTLTELIYVSNEIADGEYLLNLQIAPFAADASPSRPILFHLLN
ncbi:MAG TPA: cyclase family protein [Pyrinomonadaceae bacterium]|nr:cyclase family protein [Pyrinomonadaceae bacterium]